MNDKTLTKNKVITVRLNDEQYAFLEEWKKRIEEKMEMEVPMGALLRRALDKTIYDYNNNKHMYDFKNNKFADLSQQELEERLKQAKAYIEEYNNEK